ncbi:amino acid adenylation domain-containing protein [Sporosarcina sp. FSL W8-0480]|uniref:amino acid adenylation domain-containing protein n=1 Tax=Sporosarcina sp. FSL W8-0480 TaxID=2954701 RepID=UPI0030D7BCE0
MIGLSESQKQIIDIESIFENTSINTLGIVADFKSNYSYEEINEGLNHVLKELDAFQIRYIEKDTDLYQTFESFHYEDIPLVEITTWNVYEQFKAIHMSKCYFNKGGKLYEIYILHKPNGKMSFALFMHHSIADAWSLVEIFSKKLRQYMLRIEVEEDPEASFEEYIKKEHEEKDSKRKQKSKEYWTRLLEKFDSVNQYPKASSIEDLKSRRMSFNVDEEETKSIVTGAENCGVSLPVLFLSSLILLNSYEKQTDSISLGVAVLGRKKRDRKIFGEFVHLLPLLATIDKDMNAKEFLLDIQQKQTSMLRHSSYTYNDINEYMNRHLKKDLNLLEIGYSYQNANYDSELTSVLDNIEWLNSSHQYNALTVHVSDRSKENELSIDYDYRISLFDEEDIERMHDRLVYIVKQLIEAANKSISISDMNILPPMEQNKILLEFNKTPDNISKDETIVSVFEKQVFSYPDKVAIAYRDQRLTYPELNKMANQIAFTLRKNGIKSNDLVAIVGNKGIEIIAGILGVLKSGAAYIPIDSKYPKTRIEYMLEDSNPKLVLCTEELGYTSRKQINLNDDTVYTEEIDTVDIKPESLAYIIYTSGTTGQPKGVMIEHHNVVNLSKHHRNHYEIDDKDSILQFANLSFDAAVWEIIMALFHGGTLVLTDDEIIEDPQLFSNYVREMGVTVVTLPPQYFLLTELDTVRLIITAGSESNPHVLNHVKQGIDYVNAYGPTESTVCATDFFIRSDERANYKSVPIGKPTFNTQIYILQGTNLCGIRMPGELCIAGGGVGRGYLNRVELTEEKFIDNPFGEGKLYRTGDLAQWLPDGNVEYIGRIDDQVKIRGYRVELGEIESCIRHDHTIKDVAVVVQEYENDKKIHAFIAFKTDSIEADLNRVKNTIRQQVPEYMVPSFWHNVEDIPKTRNGKVDHKALLLLANSEEREFIAPKTSLEKKLCSIYMKLLNRDRIGITDNFFELGGHSILAMELVNLIKQEIGKDVKISDVFKHPVVEDLAFFMNSVENLNFYPIPLAEMKMSYPMISSAKRMYVLQEVNPDSLAYNMPFGIEVKGNFDTELFSAVFQKLIEHHEILRTSFHIEDGEYIQRISQTVDADIRILDGGLSKKQLMQEFVRPFELNKNRLVRLGLVKLSESHGYLLFDTHHIVSDAVSINLFMEEFIALCNGGELEKQVIQYKNYSEWFNTRDLQAQKDYWHNIYKTKPEALHLPYDAKRPMIKTFNGDRITIDLQEDVTAKIRRFANENHLTDYMILLGGLMITLHKYSHQEDIVIGSPMFGRTHKDVEKALGMFVNTLAMRGYPNAEKTIKDFLDEVKEHCMGAYENQEYPFEELVDEVVDKRDPSRNPLFDVSFTLQNAAEFKFELNTMSIEDVFTADPLSKFDIDIEMSLKDGTYKLNCIYNTDLFKRESIELMMNRYIKLLSGITADTEQKIEELDSLIHDEFNVITSEFNRSERNYDEVSVKQIFEEMADKFPTKTAIVFEDKEMTYAELNNRANELAHELLEKGVAQEEPVVILSERSLQLIVGILGVLKAGASYVPIDHTYPKERIDFIVEDVGAKTALLGEFDYEFEKQLTKINLKDHNNYRNSTNPNLNLEGNHLAYIMYTSGTSGKPKGSLIEHKSIIRLVKEPNFITFNEETRILQTGSIAFDASTFEFFGCLLNGGTLYLETQDTLTDVNKLSRSLKENKINTLWMTSSLFNQMLDIKADMFEHLENLFVGGEELSVSHVRKFKSLYPNIKIINGYGPTENTTFTTTYEIPNDFDTIPIGKPISGTQVYVLNGDKLCGIGVPGELCITGSGVSRGYLNRDDLNKEKFVDNKFGKGKMYRSGDLVRWLPDGNIEYLGRIDQQVKIRGYRVELQEIEEVFNKQAGIKETVVIAKEVGEGDKALYAYVVMEEKESTDIAAIREGLRKELPEYMIPSYIMAIDEIPLTVNGKADKNALPDIGFERQEEFIAPTSDIEIMVATTFEEVLNREPVGLNDSFFELGGDSIKAIQVSSIVRELGYRLSIKDIMNYQTVGSICNANVVVKEIEEYSQDSLSGEIPLSPIQSRFLQLDLKNPNHFNQSIVLEVESPLNGDILKAAIQKIVKHHDMLRVVYDPRQRITAIGEKEGLCAFSEVFIEDDSTEEIERVMKYEQSTMDIQNGPLLHAVLFHAKTKDYLMVCAHHLAVDGVSWRIIVVDIFTVYNQLAANKQVELPKKTASYLDWVESLMEFGQSHLSQQDEKHWKEIVYEGRFTDRLFGTAKTEEEYIGKKRLGVFSVEMSKEKCTQMIMQYHRIFGIETDEFFITALNIALKKWRNTSSYILELESHGREELNENININRTVGWFTTIYPMILKPNLSINDAIVDVRRSFLKVPNQGISYGILRYLHHDESLTVDADIIFNFLGETTLENHELKGIAFSDRFNQFDIADENQLFHPLTINGAYVKDKVVFTNYYDHQFISKADMESFEKHFLSAIEELYKFANSEQMPKERVNLIEEVSSVELLDDEIDLLNQLMEGIGAND